MSSQAPTALLELIRACVESSEADAWPQFVARFHRPIGLSVLRVARRWGGLPPEAVADLVQETYLKLCDGKCALLYTFALNHPEAIEGYVRTIAANVTHDFFKSRQSAKHGAGAILQAQREHEAESDIAGPGSLESIQQGVLLTEIDECLNLCTEGPTQERDRFVFWLYYRHGLSAREIAALPVVNMGIKGVESAILRLTRKVRRHLQDANADRDSDLMRGQNAKGLKPVKSFI